MSKKEKMLGFWIFIFFLTIFLFVSSGRFGGDGLENYLTAQSIVQNHNFYIYDKPFEVKEIRYEPRGILLDNGKRVSGYGLGLAFLLVPFYFLGNAAAKFFSNVPHDYITQFAVSFFNPFVSALLSLALFRLLLKLGYTVKTSFVSVFIYSVCTINFIYSRSGFAEPTVAFLVTLAVFELLSFSKDKKISALLIAGICVGYTMFIKINSFLLLPGFIAYFCYLLLSYRYRQETGWTAVSYSAIFLLPIAFSFFAIVIQNKILYTGIMKPGLGDVKNLSIYFVKIEHSVKGIYYYLISPGKGLLIYNIALILGLFSIRDFFKKEKYFCLFIILLFISCLGYYACFFTRGSLFSWGPRYLFPVLPLTVIFFAEFLSTAKTFFKKTAVALFAVVGFFIQLPAIVINFSRFLFFVKERLGLPEYFIDFMPDLSPIKGSWALMLSLLNRHITGASLSFTYNPDYKFFAPISMSLQGYEVADIWWINLVKISPSLLPVILVVTISLMLAIAISFMKLRRLISRAS